ncbi:hypothetical protein [Pacificibacter marinus]|jgi:hypothetical protein|uniref:Uncharacterized protein n=1 Tax=Pacificibacter marinus TaxID=658057 RepID=A0A1Y5TFL7_9RHOB|nr:hypothetical protein [Pacificibacter marinus]SEL16996.1 hypothetical protein SAMN04488032_11329 [Pacificibacter marinus]SLN63085.1 hypothetical protein PAM7971_03265 [Pacificibacter marinus]
MKQVPKETTDDALIREFLEKGGSISKGKTKPMPNELRISNNAWNTKLTKEEKASQTAAVAPGPAKGTMKK